ncbi:hypothetical protein AMJ49_03485 [Parcubacteria bacterium DG_74_2]|nr:MAG: hypothetical protein AMJ49_03485 [Parcubacteria bacterium DG_74_2]
MNNNPLKATNIKPACHRLRLRPFAGRRIDTKILVILSFLLVFIIGLPEGVEAESALLYLSPARGTFFVGSTFDVSVFVDTQGNNINAVQVDLKFPPDLLQVTSPTAGTSFISIWADQPSYSNQEGTINFKGGVSPPGINTSAGLVSTISFRAKAPGKAIVSFLDSSKVLLADGKGTNILKTTTIGEYDLVIPPPEGPKIYSPTHPNPDTWYRDKNPVFYWEKEEGMTDFSYSLDQDPRGIPDNVSETSFTTANFSDVSDGVWYFHLKAKKGDVWGGVSHYPIRIDNTPPEEFEVKVERMGGITGFRFFAHFSTTDLLSGIDHYEGSAVNMNDPRASANPFFIEATSPYRIPYEAVGKYAILVKAYDRAGNFNEAKSILNIVNPFFSYTEKGIKVKNLFFSWWLIYFFLAILLIFAIFLFYNYIRSRNLRMRLRKEVAEAEKEIEDVRKLERRIREMRILEEEAKKEEERLAKRLRGE